MIYLGLSGCLPSQWPHGHRNPHECFVEAIHFTSCYFRLWTVYISSWEVITNQIKHAVILPQCFREIPQNDQPHLHQVWSPPNISPSADTFQSMIFQISRLVGYGLGKPPHHGSWSSWRWAWSLHKIAKIVYPLLLFPGGWLHNPCLCHTKPSTAVFDRCSRGAWHANVVEL